MTDNTSTDTAIEGTCHCQQISIRVVGPPKSCSICHCSICRSLSCSYFSVQLLHDRRNVVITAKAVDRAEAHQANNSGSGNATDEGGRAKDEEESCVFEIDPSSSMSQTMSNGDVRNEYVVAYQTSPHVTRYRCSKCFSPVYATLGKGAKTIAIPQLVLFAPRGPNDDTNEGNKIPEVYQPTHHMYYSDRFPKQLIDKIFLDDGLPKYVGTSAEAPNRRRIAWTKELEYEKN